MLRLARTWGDVRPGEGAAAAWSFAAFFCLLSGYMVLRPLRETMGTAAGGSQQLAGLFTATFVATLLAAPLFGALASRLPRRLVAPVLYHAFAVQLLAFFVALRLGVPLASLAKVFFVWVSVYNLFVVSAFWSVMVDAFTSEQSRRLFGVVAAGGSCGAIAGPLATTLLAERLGVANLLLISAILLEACVPCFARVRALAAAARAGMPSPDAGESAAAVSAEQPLRGSWLAGLTRVARSPYLVGIGLLAVFHACISTFLYLEQARLVREAIEDPARRTAFFAGIDLAVNVLNVSVQLLFTGRILSRLGVAAGLLALPALSAAGLVALATVPSLAVLAVVQALRRSCHHALDRPARETLFTVVPVEDKYKAKSFLDTVVVRAADAGSAWAPPALGALGLAASGVLLAAAPLVLPWACVALWLARRRDEQSSAAATGAAAVTIDSEIQRERP